MSDGDALLRAILINPAEDMPRLMYADWLQEHGDEPRAEYIRASVEIDQLPGCGHPRPLEGRECHWCRLRSVEIMYLGSVQAITSRALGYGQAPRDAFRRGFVCAVSPTLEQFASYAKFLFSTHPIELISLRNADRYARGGGGRPIWWATDAIYDHDCIPEVFCPDGEWPSFNAAQVALESRLLTYGRSLAGLPELVPVPLPAAM